MRNKRTILPFTDEAMSKTIQESASGARAGCVSLGWCLEDLRDAFGHLQLARQRGDRPASKEAFQELMDTVDSVLEHGIDAILIDLETIEEQIK